MLTKSIYCFLLSNLFFLYSFGQPFRVTGFVKDTSAKINLSNASVALLRAKDSVLVRFSRADANGNFTVNNLPEGKHILLIAYPNYADYTDEIDLKKDENLGQINMLTRAVALQTVVVHGGGAIRIKGDTLAFMADSFKVREGANVEALLKKLPGITVNKKGEITAQGEKVQKVLVDGEEFFGDDPTMATQNLNASAVKEVQVFDKKSDQATFTGVDDGQKTKTINLKLKDDAKHGYFGKLALGGGLPNTWENTALINAFKKNRKLSVFGKMGNTDNIPLNWQDEQKFGLSNDNITVMEDGGIMISNNDNFTPWQVHGLPTAWQTGISYSNKFNDNKNNLNGSYRYQKINTEGSSGNNSQYILPDTQYFNNSRVYNFESKDRHKINGSYDIQLDSLQSLKFSFAGNVGATNSNYNSYSEALAGSGLAVNKNQIFNTSTSTNHGLNSNLLWRKKFKKFGRTLSINLSENYAGANKNGYLNSQTQYFKTGLQTSADSVNQNKLNNNSSLGIDAKIAYTEPLSKKSIIEISYDFGVNNSEQKLLSYDKNGAAYDKLNPLYSNDYSFNTTTNTIGLGYKYNDKKFSFGFGSDIRHSAWKQTNLFNDSSSNYSFSNFSPRANFELKIKQNNNLTFNYSGFSRSPSLVQLAPVRDNSNTLNVAIGNPNLKQSFNHNFYLRYYLNQILKERSIYFRLNYSPVINAFSSIDNIDSVGRKTYQAVNVNGNYSFNGSSEYTFKFKKSGVEIGFGFDPSFYQQYNFINGLLNKNITKSLSVDFNIYKYVDRKYDFRFRNSIVFNNSQSSIRPDITTQYYSGENSIDIGIQLPWKLEFNTDANYEWRQKTSAFDPNTNRTLWNMSLEKKLFKEKNMKLGFRINDILNQNTGFNRYVSSNYVNQSTYDVLKRYWLLTFTWNFNSGPKKSSDDD